MAGAGRYDLNGRNGRIWRRYCQGHTQEAIAAEFNLDQSRISQIISEVRQSIPEFDRSKLVQREVDFLDQARQTFMELADQPLPPAFDTKGNALRDPATKQLVRDASGRVAALKAAMETGDRLAKLLGLNAPAKTELTLPHEAQEAAAALAAAALARLEAEQ